MNVKLKLIALFLIRVNMCRMRDVGTIASSLQGQWPLLDMIDKF